MSNILVNALWITLIGMGLVFIALLLLWGMMELMMRATSRAARAEVEEASHAETAAAAPEAPAAGRSKAALAAAVAVAVALAQHQAAVPVETPMGGNISVWQAAMRTARLNQRANQYMRKQRGSR